MQLLYYTSYLFKSLQRALGVILSNPLFTRCPIHNNTMFKPLALSLEYRCESSRLKLRLYVLPPVCTCMYCHLYVPVCTATWLIKNLISISMLKGNLLDEIEDYSFSGLSRLHNLDLSHNNILTLRNDSTIKNQIYFSVYFATSFNICKVT